MTWGLIAEGTYVLLSLNIISVFYILWFAVMNTAFAFTLWNKAMQNLHATKITILNGLTLPEITILAIIFLDEKLSLLNINNAYYRY